MQLQSKISTTFSFRELRSLQMLYRSRELANLWQSAKAPIVANSQINRELIYIYYGSRGALSPNQRALFRAQLSRITTFKGGTIKFSLFSTPVAQSVRAFSSLSNIRSLLKGTSYQRAIRIPTPNTSSSESVPSDFLVSFQFQRYNLFNTLKSIQLSEETFFDFKPGLAFLPSTSGAKTPRRYNQLMSTSKAAAPLTTQVGFCVSHLNLPGLIVFSTLLYFTETLSNSNKETKLG